MLSSKCSLQFAISDWFNIFQKQLVQGKRWPSAQKVRPHNNGRVMQRTSMVTAEENSVGGGSDVARLLQWDENRTTATRRAVSRQHALTICCLEFNFLSTICMSTTSDAFSQKESNQGGAIHRWMKWEHSCVLFWAREFQRLGEKKIHVTHFLWWFIAWFVTRMHPAYFLSY